MTFTGVPIRRGGTSDASPHGCVHSLRLAAFARAAERRKGNGVTAIWAGSGYKIVTSGALCNRSAPAIVFKNGCVYALDECPSKSGVAGQSAAASSQPRASVQKLKFTLSGMLRLGNEPSGPVDAKD